MCKYYLLGDYVVIVIPEGKTMLSEEGEIPAPNWTCSIHKSDIESLRQYLTDEQINGIN